MKVGDLVKLRRGWGKSVDSPERFGIIVEVPLPDDYWGDTAVVEWLDGFREKRTTDNLDVINVVG